MYQVENNTIIGTNAGKPARFWVPFIVKKQIDVHLERCYPEEGCGFVFGQEDQKSRKARMVWPVQNVKQRDRTRRFVISAKDYLRAERLAVEKDLLLLGIYHSHPDHPSHPSHHDLKVALPYFSYFIISVQNGRAGRWTSWRLEEGSGLFEEEKIIFKIYNKRS